MLVLLAFAAHEAAEKQLGHIAVYIAYLSHQYLRSGHCGELCRLSVKALPLEWEQQTDQQLCLGEEDGTQRASHPALQFGISNEPLGLPYICSI